MFLAHEISRPHTISANVELCLVNIYVRFYSGISLLLRIEFKRVKYTNAKSGNENYSYRKFDSKIKTFVVVRQQVFLFI